MKNYEIHLLPGGPAAVRIEDGQSVLLANGLSLRSVSQAIKCCERDAKKKLSWSGKSGTIVGTFEKPTAEPEVAK